MGTIIKAIALDILSLVISWVITCGFVKLITLCFGIGFTWAIGTGVWLIMRMIYFSFTDIRIKINRE